LKLKLMGIILEPIHVMYWNKLLDIAIMNRVHLEPIHVMYWNFLIISFNLSDFDLEPIHVMYWNIFLSSKLLSLLSLEPIHVMYWNYIQIKFINYIDTLNRYMWCIEIFAVFDPLLAFSWTDTCDVLKSAFHDGVRARYELEPIHVMYWNNSYGLESRVYSQHLNRYMWCIEMQLLEKWLLKMRILNRYMWCIEI
jgi:hypothetical protein